MSTEHAWSLPQGKSHVWSYSALEARFPPKKRQSAYLNFFLLLYYNFLLSCMVHQARNQGGVVSGRPLETLKQQMRTYNRKAPAF
jgi:hypothetical protein